MLVLLDKKVNFNVININLKKKPDWFVAETFGLVPVILYKDDIIPESLITSDLADELFPGAALTPADPVAKAKDRVVLEIFGKVISNFYKTLLAKVCCCKQLFDMIVVKICIFILKPNLA